MTMTNIEQSKKLLEHGFHKSDSPLYKLVEDIDKDYIPRFSIETLLKKLPCDILINNNYYNLDIKKYTTVNNIELYQIAYKLGRRIGLICVSKDFTEALVNIHCKIYDSLSDEAKKALKIF